MEGFKVVFEVFCLLMNAIALCAVVDVVDVAEEFEVWGGSGRKEM